MEKKSIIYIAGHKGLLGSAIYRELEANGYYNIITKTSIDLDLRNYAAVANFLDLEKPEYIFFAAGTVGGIIANMTYPANFISDNISMASNIIKLSHEKAVKKLLYFGSSCVYPKNSPQPIKEEYLMSGPLEESNKPYAIAKIAGIELCFSYNKQYNTDNIVLMPTNLFGINDNYHPQNSHLQLGQWSELQLLNLQ